MNRAFVVEREAVLSNLKIIRQTAGNAMVIGVLKGDAYGLGLIETARMMRETGIHSMAVTEPRDLVRLRDAGFTEESILMLRSTCLREELETIIDCGGIATIGSYAAATTANTLAQELGTMLSCHIEIDTGMGRYGFLPVEANQVISVFRYMKSLHVTGMYTHFCKAFLPGIEGENAVKNQLEKLQRVVSAVRDAGYDPGILHAANSPALFRFPEARLDAVRVGSAYTGRLAISGDFKLQKTGYAECPVVDTRWIEKGTPIGYGSDYIAPRRMLIGVIPLGYSDGYGLEKSREKVTPGSLVRSFLKDAGHLVRPLTRTVTIRGKSCRVLGRVGMLHTVVELTDTGVVPGDIARFECNPLIAGQMLPKRYI